ncbi:hypothetical protein V5F44_20540 [Xanthobacter sp. V2C-8]|uniref:hypothetical protein n=1 Tax=Xanthobacter albus TaxID=3119929 RepID=UPI003728716E
MNDLEERKASARVAAEKIRASGIRDFVEKSDLAALIGPAGVENGALVGVLAEVGLIPRPRPGVYLHIEPAGF